MRITTTKSSEGKVTITKLRKKLTLKRAPAIFVSFKKRMKSGRLMVVLFSCVQYILKP